MAGNKSDFVMPAVSVGQLVHWFPGGTRGQEPVAAVVTKVGDKGVALSLLHANMRGLEPRDGVRHMADPLVKRDPDAGGWDYHPRDAELADLRRQLAQLSAKK